MITTDSPKQQDDVPTQPIKFHQRLTHSFSIRTSSSTQLQRSQSVASEPRRQNGLPLLWRQQRASTDSATPQRKQSIMDKELPRIPNTHRSSPLDRLQQTSPTLREFHSWISEYLAPLSRANHIISPSKLVIAKECLGRYLDNVDNETFDQKIMLKNQLQAIEVPTQSSFPVLAGTLKSLLYILTALKPTIYYQPTLIQWTESASTFTLEIPCLSTQTDYDASSWPAHLAPNTHWFRSFFCGKDYTTLIVPISKTKVTNSTSSLTALCAIITAIQEPATATHDATINNDSVISNNSIETNESTQYRLIIRHPKYATMRYIVSSTQVNDYLNKKEPYSSVRNGSPKPLKQQRRSLRGNNNTTSTQQHFMTAAILCVRPEFDMTHAIYLSAETTKACHLEKDLLRLDGIEIPPAYKFGILNIKDDQTKEEEWFSNTGLTDSLDRFLTAVGTRTQLEGYDGYTAGLDNKTGETGDTTVTSRWKEFDIMFHVAALMPFHPNDKQQVQRKRYIGNDIVCLIFIEGNAAFDPKAIRSKFLHVYIVVRMETINQSHRWRVEIIRKNNVPEFGPPLPNPPLFYDDQILQKYLTLKLISAENAALKCDNFSIPNNRARAGIIQGMVEKGIAQENSIPSTTTANDMTRTIQRQQSQSQRRPKSSSGDRFSRNSLRSIRSNPDNGISAASLFNNSNDNGKQMDPPIPPIPSPTRSTMLQDLKKFALRRAPNLSPLQQRTTATADDKPLTSDEKPTHYTNPMRPITPNSAFEQEGIIDDEPSIQRSFLATKAKSPFFKSSSAPSPTATTSQVSTFTQPEGLKYKTQNLMINVVGRRATARSIVTSMSD